MLEAILNNTRFENKTLDCLILRTGGFPFPGLAGFNGFPTRPTPHIGGTRYEYHVGDYNKFSVEAPKISYEKFGSSGVSFSFQTEEPIPLIKGMIDELEKTRIQKLVYEFEMQRQEQWEREIEEAIRKAQELIEGPGSVVRTQYELDQGFKLQERFDFSHGKPHVNYEIISPYQKKLLKKILGDAHRIDLF